MLSLPGCLLTVGGVLPFSSVFPQVSTSSCSLYGQDDCQAATDQSKRRLSSGEAKHIASCITYNFFFFLISKSSAYFQVRGAGNNVSPFKVSFCILISY